MQPDSLSSSVAYRQAAIVMLLTQPSRHCSSWTRSEIAEFTPGPTMIRCHDRRRDRAHHRATRDTAMRGSFRTRQLVAVLLSMLMPMLAHAKPLITPATPLPGTGPSTTTEPVIKPEPDSTVNAREPGIVRKTEPARTLKPDAPKAQHSSLAVAPSAATPGLYLSGTADPGRLPSAYRLRGLLPPGTVTTELSKTGAAPTRASASRAALRDSSAGIASAPAGQAPLRADANGGVPRASRQRGAASEASQAADACSRMQDGTLVIRTGQADSRCSGAEFRAQLSRQLKSAMADIDASPPEAVSAGMVSGTSQRFPAWRHVTITAPPPSMSVVARAPGEDNLRRLNSRSSWAEQYQARMTEIRTGP